MLHLPTDAVVAHGDYDDGDSQLEEQARRLAAKAAGSEPSGLTEHELAVRRQVDQGEPYGFEPAGPTPAEIEQALGLLPMAARNRDVLGAMAETVFSAWWQLDLIGEYFARPDGQLWIESDGPDTGVAMIGWPGTTPDESGWWFEGEVHHDVLDSWAETAQSLEWGPWWPHRSQWLGDEERF